MIFDHPIWNEYAVHRDLNILKEEWLTSPLYSKPANTSQSLLQAAIDNGDLDAAKLLLELGENPNTPAKDGFTFLHTAVDQASNNERNSREIIELLLSANADPNNIGIDGASPFHRAILFDLSDIVKLMLSYGANLELRTIVDGCLTPLMYACVFGSIESIKLLLRNKPKPDVIGKSESSLTHGPMGLKELVETFQPKRKNEILNLLPVR